MTRDHQRVTEYLLAENTVLREQLRGRRIRYTDAQRRRLASAAKKLARKAIRQLDTLVTSDTLMRWYRWLVAKKYDGASQRPRSRPRRSVDVVELVLRMARENASWGYTRIRGALYNLGHEIGRNTIKRILIEAGIRPRARAKQADIVELVRARALGRYSGDGLLHSRSGHLVRLGSVPCLVHDRPRNATCRDCRHH